MPTFSNDDLTLSHTDSGGDGRPVVLIHGWPLAGASWSEQVPALTDAGYRVITYDRRGFGASDKPETGYGYDELTSDTAALLEQLDLRDATLVGFSMGGGEAVRYVAQHGPDRVRSIVLAGAVPPYLLETDDNPDGGLSDEDVTEMQDGVRQDRQGFLDGFTRDFFSADGELRVTEEQRQEALALAAPARDEAVLACIDSFARTDFRGDLEAISLPTLVIHGSADAIVPLEVSGERTARALPQAELVVVEGGPHGFNVSHADELNRALLEFLAD